MRSNLPIALLQLTLALAYLVVGSYVIVYRNELFGFIPSSFRVFFGIVCILYGGLRLYRAWMIYKQKN